MLNKMGESFKIMRKSRGITLSEATGEEFSESMLSRFENGQSEMSAQKLFACLDNIYLDIEEYNLLVREYEPTDFSTLQKNIHHFYNPYNEIELEKLAKKELDKIKIDGREQYHRLNNILIMTTRQTGGLNKGYKPTSPASA